MLEEWKSEIAKIVHWKQIAAECDKQGAIPWHLPKIGATPQRILEAEREIGRQFSDDFKELLSLVDGWTAFCVLTDLFGTVDFVAGRAEKIMKNPEIRAYLVHSGFNLGHVIPIGGSDVELDVFLLISPVSTLEPNAVLWWAGEEIDRYKTFKDFFSSMVNYNAQIAGSLAKKVN